MPRQDLLFHPDTWFREGHGPRYEQLYRHLVSAIADGTLRPETQIPPERELAELAQVSRVTVRKAVAQLVEDGQLEQRRGAGTFVKVPKARLDNSRSTLVSFTDYMRQRGKVPTSRILSAGLHAPTPAEQQALGLMASGRVARIERLRSADGVPMALEYSSWPTDILPDPEAVKGSLYDHIRALGHVPTHAVQRVSAANLKVSEAQLLHMEAGQAVLRIDRTGYLASGRPVEFTRGLYRSDIYDFIAELRLDASPAPQG
ncbi:GntR family transcriptional regulator [Tabrizicola oligotrophica]|uniref:GntR family transcriptional regulator n=1 Tax=Tabrizicola oligotrophica TaxID=2710650 RepID=A0A6M0QW79_9RHOB|nr:GntR family transcriptional regulator [Tabrizicola oligotrophica]NEY91699.1 GntR family transcriptional regulator [Tabrizicola oligotrophica]